MVTIGRLMVYPKQERSTQRDVSEWFGTLVLTGFDSPGLTASTGCENMVVVESKVIRGYYRTDEACETCGKQKEGYGDTMTWCPECMG